MLYLKSVSAERPRNKQTVYMRESMGGLESVAPSIIISHDWKEREALTGSEGDGSFRGPASWGCGLGERNEATANCGPGE